MRQALMLVLFGASTALAADFRTLDMGEPCDSVPTREEALASVRIRWSEQADLIYAFRGNDFGREIVFTYFCPKSHLFAGNYYFPIQPQDKVMETYNDIHARLLALYGTPLLDTADFKPAFDGSHREIHQAAWKTSRIMVHLSLADNYPNEIEGRRVLVVVFKAHQR
jgi:hypothetical protein